jgi:nitrate reductase NapE component
MKKVINFNEFMSGEFKIKEKAKRQRRAKKATQLAAAAVLPIATCGAVGTLGFAMKAFAATNAVPVMMAAPVTTTTQMAVTVGAKEWMSSQTLSTLAHVLDPLVDIMVALSFPIASVIIVGSCFFFMFGKSEKAWDGIMKAGLGYVLIQVSPLILDVLKQVGSAV